MTRISFLFSFMIILGLFACDSDPPNGPDPPGQPVSLVNAFPNLSFSSPIYFGHSNDGTNRIFVVEQRGVIRVLPMTQPLPIPKCF